MIRSCLFASLFFLDWESAISENPINKGSLNDLCASFKYLLLSPLSLLLDTVMLFLAFTKGGVNGCEEISEQSWHSCCQSWVGRQDKIPDPQSFIELSSISLTIFILTASILEIMPHCKLFYCILPNYITLQVFHSNSWRWSNGKYNLLNIITSFANSHIKYSTLCEYKLF